jgi:hypothetical protein
MGWPVLASMLLGDALAALRRKRNNPEFAVRRKDLRESYSISEVEAREIVRDPLGAAPEIPFGHLNSNWQQFRFSLPGDVTLARFDAVWRRSWGSRNVEGYTVVKNRRIGPWFVTAEYELPISLSSAADHK